MSTFRHQFRLTLDGNPYDVVTSAGDQLKAEQAIGREKQDITTSPILLQLRVAFYAFNRTFPDDPLARNWVKFQDVFDDMDDMETESGSVMDPTQQAESES